MPYDFDSPVECDTSKEFSDEKDVTAPDYAAEGLFHLAVQSVDASGKSSPGTAFFTFEILEGNVPDQIGKTVRYPLWPPHPNAKDQVRAEKNWTKTVLCLMLAFGLRKQGEFPKFTPSLAWWESLEGKQFVARVTHQKQKQKTESGKDIEWTSAQIASRDDFFPIGAEEVKNVQLNVELATVGGYLKQQGEDGI